MTDSTSRWAEALREMSGRLEEMPGEEVVGVPCRPPCLREGPDGGRLGSDGREGALP